MIHMNSTLSRRKTEDITNPHRHRTYEEASFSGGINERTPLIPRKNKLNEAEEQLNEAWRKIKSKFSKIDLANSFTATIDEYDRVVVKLKRIDLKP